MKHCYNVKGTKTTIYELLSEKYFLESNCSYSYFLILLQHMQKTYEISFVWLLLKHPIRNLGTPEIATLI